MSASDKLIANMARLTELVGEAEKAINSTKGVSTLAGVLSRLVKSAETFTEEEAGQMVANLPVEVLQGWATIINTAGEIIGKVGSASTFDRSEGDRLSAGLSAMVDGEFLDDEDAAKASELVKGWKASQPTKSSGSGVRGTGGGRKPAEGQAEKVQVTCSAHNWSTTQLGGYSDSLNSIRDQIKRHHKAQHGAAFAKGDATFANLTSALSKVVKQESAVEETEGYKVQVA